MRATTRRRPCCQSHMQSKNPSTITRGAFGWLAHGAVEIENLLGLVETRRVLVFRSVLVGRCAWPATRVGDKLAFGILDRDDNPPGHAAILAVPEPKLGDSFRAQPTLRKVGMRRIVVLQREAERFVRPGVIRIWPFRFRCLRRTLRFGRCIRRRRFSGVLGRPRRFFLRRQLKPIAEQQGGFAQGDVLFPATKSRMFPPPLQAPKQFQQFLSSETRNCVRFSPP